MTKRPKLVEGHTYRVTFTPSEWYIEANPTTGPYSTLVLIRPYAGHNAKAVTMWINRWTARGKHTVEIVEEEQS